jgi:hypothetical protein
VQTDQGFFFITWLEDMCGLQSWELSASLELPAFREHFPWIRIVFRVPENLSEVPSVSLYVFPSTMLEVWLETLPP